MAEHSQQPTFMRAVSDVAADFADLIQKEMRLARAELAEKLSIKLRAGMWMSATALFGLAAVFLIVQAMVFTIAAYGIAMQWACLIVAAGLAVLSAAAYAAGRANAAADLTPTRTLHNVKQDIATAKEQLS
jgi:uncharacterized membrane protein YqjE